ncbi:MAG: hypothetical protein IKG56_03530 [Clostridia bacterium]|nr:hypothetical protein [Clostridia bacterium]
MINKRTNILENGITLVALVVTIIVLLILAGITINMAIGSNGLIERTKISKEEKIIGDEKEQIQLAFMSAKVKGLGNKVNKPDLQEELDMSVGDNKTKVTGSDRLKVKFIDTENEYYIFQDGTLEKKNGVSNPNAMEISELYDGANIFFGLDVINYAETLPEELQDIGWQLFYAGALDGETEERIYLISKEYIKNTKLPTVKKEGVEVVGARPIPIDGSEYKAKFGNNLNDGVMTQYVGSTDVETKLQKLNSKYYSFLNGNTSTADNIKAIAYMLDTITWGKFSNSTQGYAEYAIGGPTIELLFKAYNKVSERTQTNYCMGQIDSTGGYIISRDGGKTYDNYCQIISNLHKPYSVAHLKTQAMAYWLASPAKYSNMVAVVDNWRTCRK